MRGVASIPVPSKESIGRMKTERELREHGQAVCKLMYGIDLMKGLRVWALLYAKVIRRIRVNLVRAVKTPVVVQWV